VTVLACGRTNLDDRSEEITRVLREEQGFRTDGGCGRLYDLDNPIGHMRIYRCRECARWLCGPCIDRHFLESDHADLVTPPTAIPAASPSAEAHTHPGGGALEETQQHPALVYHAPTPEQVEKINAVRDALSAAIYAIQQIVPGCAEQTLAIRAVEQASFWANKALVFNGERYL
jgi:hypothetical protein